VTILVGHSHTPEGHAALDRGVEEARTRSTPLRVLRVLQQPTTDDPTQHRDWTAAVAQARRESERLEEELAAEGVEARVELVTPATASVADVLLEACTEEEVELLVIGLRTRSRVGKLLLGSVAQQLLLQADVPVLAVKPD
jgi:nucleotide-binding universal stress UspA family protein